MTYTLQEETSVGVWSDYTGSLASLDNITQQVTITSSASDFALDQTTMHFRVVIVSTTISSANYPLIMDIYVKFVHPCHYTAFSDNGGVSGSPLQNIAYSAPHPGPITEAVADFPYDLLGSVDCGT